MSSVTVRPARRVSGAIEVPPDKSISHRAAIFGALAQGPSRIENFLGSEDCLATLQAVQDLGVTVEEKGPGTYVVQGRGLGGLRSPLRPLDLGNSGTGTRLLAGLIAGQPIEATLTGDDSLRARPMGRVMEPLRQMGAQCDAREGKFAPLQLRGGNLSGIRYILPVASAQVKSAILLAGLQAKGKTTVIEPMPSRDHTERLIRHMGGKISVAASTVELEGPQVLRGATIRVPGDISSAAFLLAAALLLEGSDLTICNVCLNPTRTGFLTVLKKMGADVRTEITEQSGCEPIGNVRVQYGPLHGVTLEDPALIPNIIDEIPILAVLAAMAHGPTLIRNAAELRVKETDRIKAIGENLKAVGVAKIEEFKDGLRIEGPIKWRRAKIDSHKDHRIAMAFTVAGLRSSKAMRISDTEFIGTSFPGFFDLLKKIAR